MPDERLPWRRSVSMVATSSDKVISRAAAISLRPCQKASSRLTLVLWPAMTIERLTTGDFISFSHFNPMQIQIAAGFNATSGIKLTFGFWPSVGETIFRCVFLRLLSLGPLAGRTE